LLACTVMLRPSFWHNRTQLMSTDRNAIHVTS